MRITLLLISLIASSGCSSADAPLDRSDLDIDVCADGRVGASALSPGTAVDSLELRDETGGSDTVGVPCSGASDMPACESTHADARSSDPWYPTPGGGAPPPGQYLVYTRGDEVGAIGLTDLEAFLAPVDTPAEAAFLAMVATQGRVDCTVPSATVVEGGHEVLVIRTSPCGGQVVELRVFVDETGETTVVEQAITNEGEDITCA